MKRARSEQMQSLILSYLKKRNYTDSEANFKFNFKFEESLPEMTTRATENADLASPNSVSLAVFSIDEYFSTFARLQKFAAADTKMKDTGISDTVYPIFCHMYLDLVMAGRKTDAGTFFKHFKNDMATRPTNFLPMEELVHMIQPSDVKSSTKVSDFRRKKYVVNMSITSHSKFLRFLHSNLCLLLMKVVNSHIHISVREGKSLFDLFAQDLPPVEAYPPPERDKTIKKPIAEPVKLIDEASKPETVTLSAPSIMSPPAPLPMITDPAQPYIPDVDLKVLRSSIQAVAESKPSVSNICLHRLCDVDSKGVTHATFSNNLFTISAGFEDSSSVLWKFSRNSSHPNSAKFAVASKGALVKAERKADVSGTMESVASDRSHECLSPDVSRINLACDFYENIKARLKATDCADRRPISEICLRAHSGTVYSSCFLHDDQYLLTCSEDTTVRLWDTSSAKNKVIYRGHAYPVWCICRSAFSLYFATGSYDKTARLWSTERTFPLRTFAGHHGDVEGVCFHGNASYLATADKTIRLWDISSGKTVRLMLGHWAAASSLAFSPNGRHLASSGEDGRIRMWDIASGALIKEMRGHSGPVYSLDFSPDGSMLASGGLDSCLRVWNTRTSGSRNSTDTNDQSINPDLIGRWNVNSGALHAVKFESSSLLHCVVEDR